MTHSETETVIIFAAVIILTVIGVATVMIRCGWIQGQASLKIVPPWQRRAPEKREPKTTPVAETTATESIPFGDFKKVS